MHNMYIEPKIKTFIQFEYVFFKLRSTWKIFPSYIEFYTMQNTYFVLNKWLSLRVTSLHVKIATFVSPKGEYSASAVNRPIGLNLGH